MADITATTGLIGGNGVTVQGNKRVAFLEVTPSTGAGVDTVFTPLSRVQFASGGAAAGSTAGSVFFNVFAGTGNRVLIEHTSFGTAIPLHIQAVGR